MKTIKPIVLSLFFIAIAAIFLSFREDKGLKDVNEEKELTLESQIVEIEIDAPYSVNDLYNSFKGRQSNVEGSRLFLPIYGSELLWIYNDVSGIMQFYYYEPSHGTSLKINVKENLLYVNGTIRTIRIDDSPDFLKELSLLNESKLKDLNCIELRSSIPNQYVPSIYKIFEKHSNIAFLGHSDFDNVHLNILQLIEPKLLSIDISGEYPKSIDVSSLKNLILQDSDSLNYFHPTVLNLLNKSHALKELQLYEFDLGVQEVSALKKLRNIKSLAIIGDNSHEVPYDWFNSFPELESLFIYGKSNFQPQQFPKLKHLGITSGDYLKAQGLEHLLLMADEESYVSKLQMELIVQQNPNLKYLDLCPHEIATISPLVKLKKLRGVVFNPNINLNYINQLKSLRYIAICEDDYNETFRRRLQQLCPKCIISQDGLCLGSGWLLLCIPLMIGFAICWRYKLQ